MAMAMARDAVACSATAAALSSSSGREIIWAPSMSRFAVACRTEKVGNLCGTLECCWKLFQQQPLGSALPQKLIKEERRGVGIRQVRKSVSEKGPVYRSLQKLRRPAAVAVSFWEGDNEPEKGSNSGRVSRRAWLMSSASVGVFLSSPRSAPALSWFPDLADANSATTAESSGRDETVTKTAESGLLPAEDIKSWYKYRGEGFVLRIPPGYEDILDSGEEEEQPSVYGEKAKEKPFVARFASPDRDEVLSIVVKPASQLRLSFFETKDISDFGSIKDAAGKFVPAGAKLVSARIVNSKASRVPRTYYTYEFLVRGMHFTMSAGVSKGRVFVLGASAPQSKWKTYGSRLRLAASTFYLP